VFPRAPKHARTCAFAPQARTFTSALRCEVDASALRGTSFETGSLTVRKETLNQHASLRLLSAFLPTLVSERLCLCSRLLIDHQQCRHAPR
jgi:hypothetical protein